jgi:hypothetical protein
MGLFFAPQCLPFAIAAVMLAALTLIEMLCLLVGFSLGEAFDKADIDDHGGAGLFSWINVGGVPILILVLLVLGIFAISGFVIQGIALAVWQPLPAVAASLAAFFVSMPAVRFSSEFVARIVPRDETYAVDLADFIGRTGEVTVGPLDQGLPGRIRVKDRHGNWHVMRARAAKDEAPIPIGAEALIVDRVADVFVAIPAPADIFNNSSSAEPS